MWKFPFCLGFFFDSLDPECMQIHIEKALVEMFKVLILVDFIIFKL